mgnify:CR=1 FL=1
MQSRFRSHTIERRRKKEEKNDALKLDGYVLFISFFFFFLLPSIDLPTSRRGGRPVERVISIAAMAPAGLMAVTWGGSILYLLVSTLA